MKRPYLISKYILELLLICFLIIFSTYVFSQKSLVDRNLYKLDKTIIQNNSLFKFWIGKTDSLREKVIIERIFNHKDTLLFSDFVHDGDYDVGDINDDGYKDFITFYHEHDVIHFFDTKLNRFKDFEVHMPSTYDMIDSTKKIYWGYGDAEYGELYDYSILYSYTGLLPHFYYKIIYKTLDDNVNRDSVKSIELYKFKNNHYDSLVFVKTIPTKNPATFDYEKFWKDNYKRLLGYH